MTKRVLLLFIVVLLSFPLLAEAQNNVAVRFGRQGDRMRIVLQSSDDFIRSATIITSPSQIEVAFPTAFDITKPGDFPFGVNQNGRILFISLIGHNVLDIKVSKLPGPARLIFDLKTASGPPSGPAAQAPQPPPQAVQPPSPAAPSPAVPQSAQPQQEKPAVIVIDPGHGGYDYGILSAQGNEKDTDLAIAKDLAGALSKNGLTVYLTRKADQYVSIANRVLFSNGRSPRIFISIHSSLSNHFALYTSDVEDLNIDDTVRPYSMSSQQQDHVEESRALARVLGTAIARAFAGTEVVLRELPLPLLNGLRAPAVLIECPSVAQVRYDRQMRGRIVDSILKGIAAYEE